MGSESGGGKEWRLRSIAQEGSHCQVSTCPLEKVRRLAELLLGRITCVKYKGDRMR